MQRRQCLLKEKRRNKKMRKVTIVLCACVLSFVLLAGLARAADKFAYVDNRDNLSANTIYSSDSANQNVTIPRDIISFKSVSASVIMGDNGIVSEDPQPYLYTEKYDYILHGIDYTDSQINDLFSVNVISVTKILDFISSDYASIKDAVKGLLIEYVLNSKKVTFIWHNGDQMVYKIAVPKIEEQNTLEFIRVYPLGVNDSFI
jgi:hypothetical protein